MSHIIFRAYNVSIDKLPAPSLPAVRAATFGSWRMLTLGSEYEDTWALSPNKKHDASKNEPKEMDSCAEEEEEEYQEPEWRAADSEKYNVVMHLDGMSREGKGDGVHQAVRRHNLLNSTPWTER